MIAFAFTMLGTIAVLDVLLHVWDAAGGVSGARARDAEQRRTRALRTACGPQRRTRRHAWDK